MDEISSINWLLSRYNPAEIAGSTAAHFSDALYFNADVV